MTYKPYGDRDTAFAASQYQGIYKDFNATWFSDVGNLIISSYVIIIFMPIIEFVALWFLRYLLRAYDQKRCCCPLSMPKKTRKKTI